jgi:hypothetical protein
MSFAARLKPAASNLPMATSLEFGFQGDDGSQANRVSIPRHSYLLADRNFDNSFTHFTDHCPSYENKIIPCFSLFWENHAWDGLFPSI